MAKHQLKTLAEIIAPMNEEELRTFAKGRALAAADSSKLEGLPLDQEKLTETFLGIYQSPCFKSTLP